MKSIVAAVSESAELKDFLFKIQLSKWMLKNRLCLKVFQTVQAETKSLFHLLFENKRFEILESIATEYNNLYDEMKCRSC